MKHWTKLALVSCILAFMPFSPKAQGILSPLFCDPARVKASDIRKLPQSLTIMELRARLPGGCLGGGTAMTYGLEYEQGGLLYFWLANKPEYAVKRILKATEKNKNPRIDVVAAVVRNPPDSKPRIIWPTRLLGQSPQELFDKEILSRHLLNFDPSKASPAQLSAVEAFQDAVGASRTLQEAQLAAYEAGMEQTNAAEKHPLEPPEEKPTSSAERDAYEAALKAVEAADTRKPSEDR